VYILLQRCKYQTLMEMLHNRGRLTQPVNALIFQYFFPIIFRQEVQYFTLQIVQVLEYLREQKVIHRDLKLGNLFLHDNVRLKMGDFGLAAKVHDESERKTTIWYLFPSYFPGFSDRFLVEHRITLVGSFRVN
jgi:serine/threonine protein kinase